MRDTEFFEKALGLQEPWRVKSVRMEIAQKCVEVEIECREGTVWAEAGERLHIQGYEQALRCGAEAAALSGAGALSEVEWVEWAAREVSRAGIRRGCGLPGRNRTGVSPCFSIAGRSRCPSAMSGLDLISPKVSGPNGWR